LEFAKKVVATRQKRPRPPTAYALTFHKISTLLTPKTRKTFPGNNQVQGTQLWRRGMPRSDGWTIHMPHLLIKRRGRASPRRITCRWRR